MLDWQTIDYNTRYEKANWERMLFEIAAKGNYYELTITDRESNRVIYVKSNFDYQKDARTYAEGYIEGFQNGSEFAQKANWKYWRNRGGFNV